MARLNGDLLPVLVFSVVALLVQAQTAPKTIVAAR
jgi:hypothetical protein